MATPSAGNEKRTGGHPASSPCSAEGKSATRIHLA